MSTRSIPVRAGGAIRMEGLEARQLLAFSALIDFQPPNVPTQSGYQKDTGAVFGNRGNGLTYGWNATNNNGIDRNNKKSPSQLYDTFIQTQKNGNFTWEIAVPNGTYDVRPVAGDAASADAFYHFLAEGQNIIFQRPSSPSQLWVGGNMPVTVTDGRLTISNGASAVNNKLAFIEIRKAVPTRPTALKATAVSSSQINLTWTDAAINEDGFIVERKISGSGIWQQVATLAANTTSFSDTGLNADTTYFYQMRAFNDVGQSQNSVIVSAATQSNPALAPAAPSDLALVSMSGFTATISWADNSDNEEKFIIQAGWNGTAFTTRKEVPANTTSTTIFLGSGAVQDLRVVARNTAGGSSAPSNMITIATPPEAPVYPIAQATSSTTISLGWESFDSCQFHVERLNNVTGLWERIASDVISLGYGDTGLTPGTTYSYRIIAVAANSAGDSAPSDVVSATTAPLAVTGLHVTNRTSNSVALSWNDVSGEGFYSVERSLDGVNWTTVTFLYPDTTSYTVTGLVSATTYQFRVTGMAMSHFPGERGAPVTATTL